MFEPKKKKKLDEDLIQKKKLTDNWNKNSEIYKWYILYRNFAWSFYIK